MKIAVVQHDLTGSAQSDTHGVAVAVESAWQHGAAFVVVPELLSLTGDDDPFAQWLDGRLCDGGGTYLMPRLSGGSRAFATIVDAPVAAHDLGALALLVGDACMDPTQIEPLVAAAPDVAVLLPRSESDLQAEAVLEVALALSDSLCGLVIVADCVGAEPGDPGHGGSAIIFLGEMVAEANDGAEVLFAEVTTPVAQPEPREPLPQMPTILAQRLSAHGGHRFAVDYLADLTDGAGPS